MKKKIIVCLIAISALITVVNASTIFYNKALLASRGGMASASSPSFVPGFDPDYAINREMTFCNNAINCSGTYTGKLFKSSPANNSSPAKLIIDMKSTFNIISLHVSLDESDPE
jgi:hypothetical protein